MKIQGTLIGAIIILVGVFVFELLTPLGYVEWLLYLPSIIIASRGMRWSRLPLFAIVPTILIVAGYFLSPQGGNPWIAVFNRVMGIFTLWIFTHFIAERLRTEEALGKSEERFRAVYEQAAIGIEQVALDGRLLDINDALCRMLGYERHELLGRTYEEITHPDDFPAERTLVDQLLNGSIPNYSLEECYIRKDGQFIWVRVTSSLATSLDGKPQYRISLIEDITERKRAEERLQHYAEELERSNRELNQFASIASHDLQEPLKVISGFSRLIERRYGDTLGTDAKEFFTAIIEGVDRMERLISDLLAYSRVSTRGKPFERVDSNEVFEKACANLRAAIEENGAEVTSEPLPTILADEIQLIQLFQNLIGNAIKYRSLSRPPRIHLSAEQQKGEWVFHVQDNGIGIEPRNFDRIFQIFQRLHTREEHPGTGIGLAICKKIVERHGGRIWVDSVPEEGSTFSFSVPVTRKGQES